MGLLRLKDWRWFQIGQLLPQFGENFGDVGSLRPHLRLELLWSLFLNVGTKGLQPGLAGWRALFFVTAAPHHLGSTGLGVRG